jgi:anaerobic carbon-monoxide dehydrogenase iron sulfur subunit
MKKLAVRLERCTGCGRCEVECMAEHSDVKNYILARLSAPQPNTRIFVDSIYGDRAVPLVCRHCHEAPCVSACMSGCMQKDPVTGIVTNMGHEQQCVGCWMCIMACPYGVILPSQDVVEVGSSLFPVATKCDFCPNRDEPACVAGCPNEAIQVIDWVDIGDPLEQMGGPG